MLRSLLARRLSGTRRVRALPMTALILVCSLALSGRDFPGELVAGLAVKEAVDTTKCAHCFLAWWEVSGKRQGDRELAGAASHRES